MITRDLAKLQSKSAKVRAQCLEDAVRAQKGHLGGCFSCVELLVSLYYGGGIRIRADDPRNADRDFFFLGKGHACLSLYPILNDLGFLSTARYKEYGEDGASVGGQLDVSIPGVENNTGSLGHALGLAAGVALSAKLSGSPSRAIAMLGDAECDEGSIWEAIMFCAEHNLNNVVCIIDRNRLSVTTVMNDSVMFRDFGKKMDLFGWDCHEINGHDYTEIFASLDAAAQSARPTMILADTIKGKGVSFMEGETKWHHSIPTMDEVRIARQELGLEG
ncbi:MAG: transketolase [Paracoccaceae bacterium]